jgi:hypothetical protein
VLSDLAPESCVELGYFVDASEDSAKVLMKRTTNIQGIVKHASYSSISKLWELSIAVDDEVITTSGDALILACGCVPCMLGYRNSSLGSIWNGSVEQLDKFVNPKYVSQLFAQESCTTSNSDSNSNKSRVWCVVGTSHSAMLVIMNLVSAGAKFIVNIYRSEEFRFQHHLEDGSVRYPGIGLVAKDLWATGFEINIQMLVFDASSMTRNRHGIYSSVSSTSIM